MLRKPLALAAFSLSLLLTGCGSGGSTGTTTPTTPEPILSASATTLTFPSTTVGQTSASQTITLTNTGNATLTLGSYNIAGATADFTETSASTCTATTTTLTANQSCTLVFTFTPQTAGALTETITATDNALSPNVTFTLTGTGTAVVPVLIPAATLSVTALTFPTTNAGSTSPTQAFTLTNTGTGPLTVNSILTGGANIDQFTETNNCVSPLAVSAFCTITVAFAPTQVGAFSASIVITDNSGNIANSQQSVTLTGTSTGPLAALSPTSLTFPGTTLNSSATAQTVTLTNNGTATLNITSITITGGVTSSAFTITANTCGTTLAVAANCSISVNFTPTILGTFLAYLTITDNAPGSPQSVTLNGTGQTAPAPIASLSTTSLSFLTTLPGATSASSSVTLTNTGSAVLNIASIVLGGTNSADFTESTTCGTTLAAAATCTITATFQPIAVASYTASITLTDNTNNVANSTQTITLSGTGGTNTTYHTLYVWPQADAGPLYTLVNNAQKSIDMTMYALSDTTFSGDLVAACKRGVIVRVILDQNSEKSQDTPAFNALNAQANCSAVWANKAFAVTHEKSIMIDGVTDVVMTLNLQSAYYSTTRDYAIVDNDSNDYAADEATFAMDYAAGTTSTGTVGTSDFSYQPGPGTDLVWSPTTASADMVAIIANATKTLYIECEEFSAPNIVSAVAAAATRGVAVVLIGENESSDYNSEYTTIKTAGATVYYYKSSTGFYVHAKTVVADLGLSTEAVYQGSINYSTASLTENRELGVYITGNTAVSNPIAATLAATTIADESQTGVTKF
jgi:phosphatidylserine/phosphatidylglycerophosphate/cardiolipin synthase-like enzyme